MFKSIITFLLMASLCFNFSNAFAPRAFLKREDPSQKDAGVISSVEEQKMAQEKRFDFDGLYGAPFMKRFQLMDGYAPVYDQPWMNGGQKRFDYLDSFYPFNGPAAKRFDYGFGPRAHPLSRFL